MLQIKRKIGPKGQIVLPKDVREQLHLRTGTEIVFSAENNKIIIEPALEPLQAVEEFCTPPKGYTRRKLSIKEIKRFIDQEHEEKYAALLK